MPLTYFLVIEESSMNFVGPKFRTEGNKISTIYFLVRKPRETRIAMKLCGSTFRTKRLQLNFNGAVDLVYNLT
jgi:hypothetical protein